MNKLYEVTDVRERRRFTPSGVETDSVEIRFTTQHGASGFVSVPMDEYDKEKVAEILQAKAKKLEIPFTL